MLLMIDLCTDGPLICDMRHSPLKNMPTQKVSRSNDRHLILIQRVGLPIFHQYSDAFRELCVGSIFPLELRVMHLLVLLILLIFRIWSSDLPAPLIPWSTWSPDLLILLILLSVLMLLILPIVFRLGSTQTFRQLTRSILASSVRWFVTIERPTKFYHPHLLFLLWQPSISCSATSYYKTWFRISCLSHSPYTVLALGVLTCLL